MLKNTAMLYLLQFSGYLFSFLTVPYQTRILGPVLYGVVGVAVATMAYFQLFMDFGFLLSATEDISLNREDRAYVSKKLTSVAVIKLAFFLISLIAVWGLSLILEPFSQYRQLYLLYVLAYGVNAFLPDYFFRGIEKMSAITVRTVSVRLLSCLLTFIFLRSADDYLALPGLMLFGNLVAVVWAYVYIYKTLGYKLCPVLPGEVWKDLKRSAGFFLARIASTVYSATNTVVMGYVDPAGVTTGWFTSADKIMATAKGAIAPISDSLYPYMVRHKNFSVVKKALLLGEPVILAGCALVWIFADSLCVFAFGEAFAGTAPVLRAFIPGIACLLPSYVLGFPTLGAMKQTRYANRSVFFGTAVHVTGLVCLAVSGRITAVSLAALTSLSEFAIMAFRIGAVARCRRKMP